MAVYDLDNVNISRRIYSTWLSYCSTAVRQLQKKYPDLQADEIPDEQFRTKTFGGGELFVKVRGTEIKMGVPSDEYEIK